MTTTYEFLPEIWNLIKEYAVPKPYEYDEDDCVFKVEIYRFLETIEDGYDKEHYANTKMIVETNGKEEDTTITFKNATTGSYIDELVAYDNFGVSDGCCNHSVLGGYCRAEFMLSDLMPEDLDDEWGIAWADEEGGLSQLHYTDLRLEIELAEKGNVKYLVDPEVPETPIHTYGQDI